LRAGKLGDRSEVAGDDASGYTSPAGGGNYGEAGRESARGSGGLGRKRTRPAQGTPRRPPKGAAAVRDSRAGWSRVDPNGMSGDSSSEDRSASSPRGNERPPLRGESDLATDEALETAEAVAVSRGIGEPAAADVARIPGRSAADGVPSGWKQHLWRVGPSLPARPPRRSMLSGPRRSANGSLLGAGSPRLSPLPPVPSAARHSIWKKPLTYLRTQSWRSSVRIVLPSYVWRACHCRKSVRRTGPGKMRCAQAKEYEKQGRKVPSEFITPQWFFTFQYTEYSRNLLFAAAPLKVHDIEQWACMFARWAIADASDMCKDSEFSQILTKADVISVQIQEFLRAMTGSGGPTIPHALKSDVVQLMLRFSAVRSRWVAQIVEYRIAEARLRDLHS
jgi:hypothetical protein